MVKIHEPLPLSSDNTIDIDAWIQRLNVSEDSEQVIHHACQFAYLVGEDCTT